jgi:hypothetical protein
VAGRDRPAISGEPGDRWRNESAKVMWQLIVAWHNSCARCIQYDHQISAWFGIPFHFGCNCEQIPIAPDFEAEPFVDFREKIQGLDPKQRARVMGVSNLAMVESGKLDWKDVVSRSRILDLHEVVDRFGFSVSDLTKAGISHGRAERAWQMVHTPAHEAAIDKQRTILGQLTAKGASDAQVRQGLQEALRSRFGIDKGAGGTGKVALLEPAPKPPQAPPRPPRPVIARNVVARPRPVRRAPRLIPRASSESGGKIDKGKFYRAHRSAPDASLWAKRNYRAWAEDLTPLQRSSLQSFSRPAGPKSNASLRRGLTLSADEAAEVRSLDQAIGTAKLPENTALYRGLRAGPGRAGVSPGDLPLGTMVQDEGFAAMGLAESEAIADLDGPGVIVQVLAPRGAPVASLDALGVSNRGEMLLPRGSTFRVVARETRAGKPDLVTLEWTDHGR